MNAFEQVKQNIWNLEYIPNEEKTYEMCLYAAQRSHKRVACNQSILCFIPEERLDEVIVRTALCNDGDALRDLPMKWRTYDNCLIAVRAFGRALTDVPPQYQDSAMCTAAVEEDGAAISCVPGRLITEEMAYTAMKSCPQMIDRIPEHLLSDRVCLRSMRFTGEYAHAILPKDRFATLMYGASAH